MKGKNWNKIINVICAILLIMLGGIILDESFKPNASIIVTNSDTCENLGKFTFETLFSIYFIIAGVITFLFRKTFNFKITIAYFFSACITSIFLIQFLDLLSSYLLRNCRLHFRDPTPLWQKNEAKFYLYLTFFIIIPQIFLILNLMKPKNKSLINQDNILDEES